MTFEQNSALPRRFVTAYLPWILGLGALVLYLATMTHWVTFNSAPITIHLAGWSWEQDLYQPLQFLVFYPFRWLPAHLIPPALNIFNAVLAALVIVLVARIISLLPHDRTADQRDLEKNEHALFSGKLAWLPPTLGALVLGLQLSFWECATAVNGNILDALVAAYVIRCLLEFRIDGQQSWLARATFFFAVGMANNWAMVGLAPVFVGVLITLKGFAFFNPGFLARTAAWAVAGWLLYLLLPFVQSQRDVLQMDFWPALKFELSSQIRALRGVYYYLNSVNRAAAPFFTSLLPLFWIALRWKSSFGDNSPIGIFIAKAVFHIINALLLVVCLLITLNPPDYGMRSLLCEIPQMFGGPQLTHAMLGVIVIGYCAGYFLLICSPALNKRNRMNPLLRLSGYAGWGAVVALLAVMPAALVGRNHQAVQLTNNKLTDQFAAQLQKDIPAGPCAFVSDDTRLLSFFRMQQLRQGKGKDQVFYDSTYSVFTDYHKFQSRLQPGLWPTNYAMLTNNARIRPGYMVGFLGEISQKMPVVYLHPSFGYYFERFQLVPRGVNYPLKSYSTNDLLPQPLSQDVIAANETFWKTFDESQLAALKRLLPTDRLTGMPGWQAGIYRRLHLKPERVYFAEYLAGRYSLASEYWAVEQQKLGLWEAAAASLERTLALNPNNDSAKINLAFNTSRRQGTPESEEALNRIEDFFHRVPEILNAYGPVDEPTLLFQQSRAFLQGNLPRQGLTYMERVAELDPNNYPAQITLADIYTAIGKPKHSLEIIQRVRANPARFNLDATNKFELSRCEAAALFRDNRKDEAAALLADSLKAPKVPTLFRVAASQLYFGNGFDAEALAELEKVLVEKPDDVPSLINRAVACMRLGRERDAIPSLTHALDLEPKSTIARLNRGIAYNRTKQFDAALEDLEILYKDAPNSFQVCYVLAEACAGKGDTARAKELYEKCLKFIPAGTPDFKEVTKRLEELKSPMK